MCIFLLLLLLLFFLFCFLFIFVSLSQQTQPCAQTGNVERRRKKRKRVKERIDSNAAAKQSVLCNQFQAIEFLVSNYIDNNVIIFRGRKKKMLPNLYFLSSFKSFSERNTYERTKEHTHEGSFRMGVNFQPESEDKTWNIYIILH